MKPLACAISVHASGDSNTNNESTAAPQPAPPQTGDMTKSNRKDGPERPGRKKPTGGGRSPEPDRSTSKYTPKQREKIHNGLRIWARVAIRSYLRQRTGASRTETGPVEEQD